MYNPSDIGKKGVIFGLPYSVAESDLVFLPIHLDVTASYGDGTSKAPNKILAESSQLDLSLLQISNPWELKMAMHPPIVSKSKNEIHRGRAKSVIKSLESGKQVDQEQVDFVNEFCEQEHEKIESLCKLFLEENKLVAIVGGDHSSPLGLIKALAGKGNFGILQIDAHMDLRKAYEGFEFSHASIMYNALQNESVSKLVQVGIRDFCEEEEQVQEHSKDRIQVYYDEKIQESKIKGSSWLTLCDEIVSHLPQDVYISFDMDGLDPSLCPNTGTPVPGGLTFQEAIMLIDNVVRTGRKIVGFDVCETGNHPWDANVASRILFRLAAYSGVSHDLLKLR